MASIKYQIQSAIDNGFGEGGHDKRSAKFNEGTTANVYSFKERDNLLQTGIDLAGYCKDNFNINKVNQITPSMVSSFLENKAETCRQSTLDNYASRLGKLGELVNNKFASADVNWRVEKIESLIGQDKLRDVPMAREDFNKILDYAKDNSLTSKAVTATWLAGEFGLRVSECCKLQARDIDLNNNILHIVDSKGGRSRDLEIQPHQADFLKSLIEDKNFNDRIINIKEDSVNKWLSRIEEKLGMTQYDEAKTGIHSIRKMAATERYHENLERGMSEKEAERDVSKWLGHGENRQDVIKNYIYK